MKRHLLWIAAAAVVAAMLIAPDTVSAKRVNAGDEFYVSAKYLPLHEQATGLSPVTDYLGFGTPVKILQVSDFENESSITGKEVDPAWALVESGGKQGYVPTRSIVRKRVLNRQDPNQAMRKIGEREAVTTGKSFSETETADLQTMKGVAGRSKSGVADEAGIDAILSAAQEYNPHAAYAPFRKEGRLGEYR